MTVSRPARRSRIPPSRRPARHEWSVAGNLRPSRADRPTQQLSFRSATHYGCNCAHQREGHLRQAQGDRLRLVSVGLAHGDLAFQVARTPPRHIRLQLPPQANSRPAPWVREIARRIGGAASTISRELHRNAATRQRVSGLPGHDRAVACRSACPPPEGGQARRQRGLKTVRARPGVREGHHDRRPGGGRSGNPLDRASARPPTASTVGHLVEPRADRQPPADRFSR